MASPEEPSQGHDATSEYYDILVVGRTGMGKSTTANKLLGIEHEDPDKRFVTRDGSESVTAQCKFLSNEQNVRVLDTPGFANTQLTKEHGPLECNLQIFEWILQEQKKHDLAFRRVLYFLPNRGPLERAEGALQEEIKVMYDFLGQDIFNIMIVIATNRKDEKYQIEFDEEDISTTEAAFTTAFESVIGQHLTKCPPVLYLPLAGTDVLKIIISIVVIADEPLNLKGKEPVFIEVMQEENGDIVLHDAQQKYPGRRLQFQVKCLRCTSELLYENFPSGMWVVKAINENEERVPLKKTKCHPIFIPKHYLITKIIGGIAHIATFGVFAVAAWYWGKVIWPGFTNSDEICPVCGLPPGSEGCSVVGGKVSLPANGGENIDIMTSHSTNIDKFQKVS